MSPILPAHLGRDASGHACVPPPHGTCQLWRLNGVPDSVLVFSPTHPLPVPAIRTAAGWRLRPSLEKELRVDAAWEEGWGSWGCRQGAEPVEDGAR